MESISKHMLFSVDKLLQQIHSVEESSPLDMHVEVRMQTKDVISDKRLAATK